MKVQVYYKQFCAVDLRSILISNHVSMCPDFKKIVEEFSLKHFIKRDGRLSLPLNLFRNIFDAWDYFLNDTRSSQVFEIVTANGQEIIL